MPSKPDIWMPLYIGDYLAATAHLDAEESGAYLHLLMHSWKNGTLPAESESLRRIAKVSKDAWSNAWTVLKVFFDFAEDGTPSQGRLEKIRADWSAKQLKSKDKAKKAAESRWSKPDAPSINSDAPSNPQAMLEPCPLPISSSTSLSIKKEQKQKPSRSKAASGKFPDPRHTPFREEIKRYMEAKGCTFIWDASEAKSMSDLLKAVPTLTLEVFQKCLLHRARSPGTPHGERPRLWIPNILRYQQSPLTQFNRTEEVNAISKADQREQRNAAAIRTAVEPEQYTGGSPQGFAPAPSFASRPRPDGDGDDRLFGDFGRLLEGAVD